MDSEKKRMMTIILRMIKEVYQTTVQLEDVLHTGSVQILARDFDPMSELLEALEYPEDKMELAYELMRVYLDDEMTLDEVVLGIENGLKETTTA
jgi:uncharacterized protein Yka (UPF0111/DUF47 family)